VESYIGLDVDKDKDEDEYDGFYAITACLPSGKVAEVVLKWKWNLESQFMLQSFFCMSGRNDSIVQILSS
jgi:hypothetical protein